jgi:hypothetical protein
MTRSLLLVHRRDAWRQLLGLDAAEPDDPDDDPDPEPDDEEELPPELDDPEPPDGAVVVLEPLPPDSFEPPDSLEPPPDSFEPPPPEPPVDPLRLSVR